MSQSESLRDRSVVEKSRLLDVFCGAGGCTKGYQRSGFYVIGVDSKSQPNYCGDEFHQADALDVLARLVRGETWQGYVLADFAAIHASPPCQAYSWALRLGQRGRDDHPRLIPRVRELLLAAGRPYVIENVSGARDELERPIMLCGSMFGLHVERHRYFECNFALMAPACQHGVWTERRFPGTPRHDGSRPLSRIVNPMSKDCAHEDFAKAMDIAWMPKRGFRPTEELREAIPPVYTEHIGHQLMQQLEMAKGLAA